MDTPPCGLKESERKNKQKKDFVPVFPSLKLSGRAWKLFWALVSCWTTQASYTLSCHPCPLVKEKRLFVSNFPIQMRKYSLDIFISFRPCVCRFISTQATGFSIGLWIEPYCDLQGCINSGAAHGSGIALDFHVENI